MRNKTPTPARQTGSTPIRGTRIRLDPPHTSSPTSNAVTSPSGVDDVVAWIRQEVVRQQAVLPPSKREPAVLPGASVDPNQKHFSLKQEAQWNRIRASLHLAEENAQAGTIVPELGRFRGITRKLARLVARGILYLGRVFTNSQRKFNIAALASVRDLHNVFRQWEQTEHEQSALDRQALADLRERCGKLERQIADLRARLESDQRPPSHGETA